MWIVVIVAVLGLGWLAWTFNRLVQQRHRVRQAWSDIDVQLKRRHDLIPKIVDAVRGFRDFEQSLLQKVTSLRSSAMSASAVDARSAAETALSQGLGQVFALVEAYPELKSSEHFLALQKQLAEVENDIQFARRYFNGCTRDLNTMIETFPNLLVAGPLGFATAPYFELESAAERQTPEVRT